MCAHVVYTVTNIEAFIRKLTSHARKTVALVSFERPATATYLPLSEMVHSETRIGLPTLPQIENLLSEMAIDYIKTPLQEWAPRAFRNREQALSESQARLFVSPGSEKSENLSAALEDSLEEADGGSKLKWAEPHRPFIVSWSV